MTSNGKAHRRSLKECLKSILHLRQDNDNLLTVGSGVLRRTGPSLALLPAFNSLSTLYLNTNTFDLDRYNASTSNRLGHASTFYEVPNSSEQVNTTYRTTLAFGQEDIFDAYHYQAGLGKLAKSCVIEPGQTSNRDFSRATNDTARFGSSLFSASSLSGISLNHLTRPDSVTFQSPLSQLAYACNVPSIYRHGTSLQASLATLDASVRSASTLRLQRSTQALKPVRAASPAPLLPRKTSICSSAYSERVPCSEKGALSHDRSRQSTLLGTPKVTSRRSCRDERAPEASRTVSGIHHFSSFCVLDTARPGCPVTATSQDLRFVFEIGEEFCLNTADVEGEDIDTVTGQDAAGNTIIHLVVYSPLINPNSGRSRFVLASLLDITTFITDAALVPELETVSEESVAEEELQTPPGTRLQSAPRYELSSENLSSDCFLPDGDMCASVRRPKDDIWLDIASEESRRRRPIRSDHDTLRSSSTSSTYSMDNMIDCFLVNLQGLYSEFFLLGKSPLDEASYEICNVSIKVHESREYINGHLTKTSSKDRARLEAKLMQENPFCMRVRWGEVGEIKQLYCIPLYGRSNVTWVCFLVDKDKWMGLPLWE